MQCNHSNRTTDEVEEGSETLEHVSRLLQTIDGEEQANGHEQHTDDGEGSLRPAVIYISIITNQPASLHLSQGITQHPLATPPHSIPPSTLTPTRALSQKQQLHANWC